MSPFNTRNRVWPAVFCLSTICSVSAFGIHRSQYHVVRQASSTTALVTAAPKETAPAASLTALSECHMHGASVYCIAGNAEYRIIVTGTSNPAPEYTGCHHHGADTYCISLDGEDVEVLVDGAEGLATPSDGSEPSPTPEGNPDEQHRHFHAGVEHCVGGGSDSSESSPSCSRPDRDYNIPIRIGLLFAILVTSFVGVVIPIVLDPLLLARFNIIFIVLKQFGTGVIISTAFVHVRTPYHLTWLNSASRTNQTASATSSPLCPKEKTGRRRHADWNRAVAVIARRGQIGAARREKRKLVQSCMAVAVAAIVVVELFGMKDQES